MQLLPSTSTQSIIRDEKPSFHFSSLTPKASTGYHMKWKTKKFIYGKQIWETKHIIYLFFCQDLSNETSQKVHQAPLSCMILISKAMDQEVKNHKQTSKMPSTYIMYSLTSIWLSFRIRKYFWVSNGFIFSMVLKEIPIDQGLFVNFDPLILQC